MDKKRKTYIDEYGEEREVVKPTILQSVVRDYYELEKNRGTIFGKGTFEDYCREIEIVFEIINDEKKDVSTRE